MSAQLPLMNPLRDKRYLTVATVSYTPQVLSARELSCPAEDRMHRSLQACMQWMHGRCYLHNMFTLVTGAGAEESGLALNDGEAVAGVTTGVAALRVGRRMLAQRKLAQRTAGRRMLGKGKKEGM